MCPESAKDDLGEDIALRESAIRSLLKLLTVYIENEYNKYLLRGDVKRAFMKHYSSANTSSKKSDEFQRLHSDIAEIVSHANEIKNRFEMKKSRHKKVRLYPLTITDLKDQARKTGDAKGAFKRKLGHLCVFSLGASTKSKHQTQQLHADLGCLVFHDDPRKKEHAWECAPELTDTLRDIQINNVTVLNANDQFIQHFPAKPRSLTAISVVHQPSRINSKTTTELETGCDSTECMSQPSIALVFPDLQMLFARNNMMREIAPLHFPHLSVLDISNNEIESLPNFDLPNLIHLDVSQNSLSGRLDVALGLTARSLESQDERGVQTNIYNSLQYLDLSGNKFEWIAEMQMHAASVLGQHMPAIRNLQLHDNPFIEATMDSFSSIIEFRARFNSEMPKLLYISPPVFSRRKRRQITSDNAEQYLHDQDRSRGVILAPRVQYEIWPAIREASKTVSKRRKSAQTISKSNFVAEENHFCGMMACNLLSKEVNSMRKTVELYEKSARHACQRVFASDIMYQHQLSSNKAKRTMAHQTAVSEIRRPVAKPIGSYPSFGFDGFLLLTTIINRINMKRAWTRLYRIAPRQESSYNESGDRQAEHEWYDSYRTQLLKAKRIQYLIKHRQSKGAEERMGVLDKRKRMLYKNAFSKMKCVRNMYRKKKCCDELLSRVVRRESEVYQEEDRDMHTEPQNALEAARDQAVEKKLKFVRDLKSLFLQDIVTYRRKAKEQQAQNQHNINEYKKSIADFATQLVPLLSQQQEISQLKRKTTEKRLEAIKLENMYIQFRKGSSTF